MRLKTRAELKAEEEARKRARITDFDHKRLAIVYTRQSTVVQREKNKEAKEMQSIDLIDLAISEYDVPEKNILPLDENLLDKQGNKLDKPRAASGRLDKNFRAGLRIAEELIEQDKVGAVFVRDVPRLFRDTERVNPPQFVALCKKHNVVIITPYKEFDFNATRRNDRRDFLKEADEGADYLESHQRMMLKAKECKGMRGDFGGHAVPTGLMLDEKRKGYLPNPYWC